MESYKLSDNIKLVLTDNDEVWPTTVAGHFRVITKGKNHNIKGKGENNASEKEMIDAVLNQEMSSRWRSKTNPDRKIANHFSINSPLVKSVFVNVGGVWSKLK